MSAKMKEFRARLINLDTIVEGDSIEELQELISKELIHIKRYLFEGKPGVFYCKEDNLFYVFEGSSRQNDRGTWLDIPVAELKE